MISAAAVALALIGAPTAMGWIVPRSCMAATG
jgi:hypothetical protein